MTISIIIALVIGIVGGGIIPESFYEYTDVLLDIGLCLLLFSAGIDIGRNKKAFDQIKRMGLKILAVPILVALGSVVGGMIAGAILKLNVLEGAAVGAGFGWYTLSPAFIAPYSAELSTIAFISNVLRELIAIIIIPFVAKNIGYLEAIAPAGATSMDTTLPIILKSTRSEITIISFVSGLILSLLVPILVPVFIKLAI